MGPRSTLGGYLVLAVALWVLCSIGASKQIDSFNLLLPTSYHASRGHARQVVTTSGECYDWESTEASVVAVQGTHRGLVPSDAASKSTGCFSNGIIELVHQGKYPSSVYVTAQDHASKEVISIPVRIRDLQKISIFTKSRIMNLKEIQNLEVYGFDEENNTFTSLEGLRFKWTITEISEHNPSLGSIEKIPLKDSSLYMPLDTRKKLQSQEGVESDLLVIRANRVGKVSVKARCLESNYELISDEIILYIQQKFQISPGLPMHLLVGSTFQYSLLTPSGLPKTLPEPHYSIQFNNAEFSSSKELLVSTPRVDGRAILTVSDTRTSPAYSQSVEIFAHQPDFIEILIPDQIIIGSRVSYQVKYYANQVLLGGVADSRLLQIKVEDEGTSPIFSLDTVGQKVSAGHKGEGLFKVSYNGLTAEKRIKSVTPLKVLKSTSKIILPLNQLYQLSVVGGSGSYRYALQEATSAPGRDFVALTLAGLVTARKEGQTLVTIFDQHNSDNRVEVAIYVIKPGHIYSIEEYKQFNLGEDGSVYVAAEPRPYTDILSGQVLKQKYTECNDAFSKDITFNYMGKGAADALQILSSDSINHRTLDQIKSLGTHNKHVERFFTSRATVSQEELNREYDLYLKAGELKQQGLEKLVQDAEDYGICSKLTVRPVAAFNAEVALVSDSNEAGSFQVAMKLRVYDQLRNKILGFVTHNHKDAILLTPLGSFRWETQGGPYAWDSPQIGELEVSINAVKLDPKSKDYLYPIVTCPNSEKDSVEQTIRYSNPASPSLLRPVYQELKITVYCRSPQAFRVGLPTQSRHTEASSELDGSLEYVLSSNDQKSTVYIYPGTCFRINVEPVLLASRLGGSFTSSSLPFVSFYNASNTAIQYEGYKQGDVEVLHQSTSGQSPRDWNARTLSYTSRNRKGSIAEQPDFLTITTAEVKDHKTGRSVAHATVSHTIQINTIQPLALADLPETISIPNQPNIQYTLRLSQKVDRDRFAVVCDDRVLKCRKDENNNIVISPLGVDSSQTTVVKIVDEYAIGRPQIDVPVRIMAVGGIDLRIARTGRLGTRPKAGANLKDWLSSDAWILETEEFTLYADVYTHNTTARQPITNINPDSVEISIQKPGNYDVVEVSRHYDVDSQLLVIHYRTSKLSGATSDQAETGCLISASTRGSNAKPLVSNIVNLRVYSSFILKGSQGALPARHLKRSAGETKTKIQAYAHVMQSCSTVLEIQGGPPTLKTKILPNKWQDKYFNVVKLSERRYRIEAVEGTSSIDDRQEPGDDGSAIFITGQEYNLLSLSVSAQRQDGASEAEELTAIECLVVVAPVTNVQIQGNSMLLVGRQVRYLAYLEQSDSQAQNNHVYGPIAKEECSLRFKWSVSTQGDLTPIQIISNTEKIGVNVTTNPRLMQADLENKQSSYQAGLAVHIYNRLNREVAHASKTVSVVGEYHPNLLGSTSAQSTDVAVGSQDLLLIPPQSGLVFAGSTLEQVSPCDRSSSRLSIANPHELVTGQGSGQPELVKLQHKGSGHHDSVLPAYINVLVTPICTVAIQNVDGTIAISPSAGKGQNGQNIRFYLMDCYGRRFQHYSFRNLQYRVSVQDTRLASAAISSQDQGMISLQGHEIGSTYVTLEVILNGVVKAVDTAPVQVNTFIQPSQPFSLQVGDLVNFKAASEMLAKQKWTSDSANILQINSRTGEAVAVGQGETYVRLGGMSTRVSVVSLTGIEKASSRSKPAQESGYLFQLIYSGKTYTSASANQLVKDQTEWRCAVLGREGQHLRGHAVRVYDEPSGKWFIRCKVEKIPGAPTIQNGIKQLKLKITAENKNTGLLLSRQFEEELDMFIVLSERYVNPRDPKHRKQKGGYSIIVQTAERLHVYQSGGKDAWILSNEFNGARQIISLDLSQYRGGQWRVRLHNPRTSQADEVLISQVPPNDGHQLSEGEEGQVEAVSWKWTDILVVFMAVNFLLILGYQIKQNNSGSTHTKVY